MFYKRFRSYLLAKATFQTNYEFHRQFAILGTFFFRTLQEQASSNLNPSTNSWISMTQPCWGTSLLYSSDWMNRYHRPFRLFFFIALIMHTILLRVQQVKQIIALCDKLFTSRWDHEWKRLVDAIASTLFVIRFYVIMLVHFFLIISFNNRVFFPQFIQVSILSTMDSRFITIPR